MVLIPFQSWRSSGLEPLAARPLSDVRAEMNRLFDGLFTRSSTMPTWFETSSPGQWLPAIDIADDPTTIQVRAELPGIDPKAVDVDVTEDRLVISGEKKSKVSKGGNGWSHVESHYGAFSRTIPLPDPVDPEKVSASFDNGILTVDLTKSAVSTSRKVPVAVK